MVRGLVLSLAAALLVLAAAAAWLLLYGLRPGPQVDEAAAVVVIEPGSSVADIGGTLAAAGLLEDDPRFVLLARIMGLSAQLPAGEFELSTGTAPVDLLRELSRARPLQHLVTLQEGLALTEIADRFAAGGWIDRDRFLELAGDPVLIEDLGLGGLNSLEGYLFPDTYSLVRPAPDERALIERLVGRSLSVWEQLAAEHDLPSGFNRHQVFTLASIVEKETGRADERPLVAGVFLNRLARGMRLQSDPTVVYGLPSFSGSLTRSDLRTPTPYNTYVIAGLPPGPICSPGEASLQAVLQPAETDYLYFVAKNDGSHHFSTNLREHNRAVRIYQRGK